MQDLPAVRRLGSEVEQNRRGFRPLASDVGLVSGGPVDVQEVDVAPGAGMYRAIARGGLDPDQVNGTTIGLTSAVAFSESPSRRTSVTITTTSSAVSFPVPFVTRNRTYAASNPPAVPTTT
jgi:hypothetical protein